MTVLVYGNELVKYWYETILAWKWGSEVLVQTILAWEWGTEILVWDC